MNSRERVLAAIKHKEVDRIPRGELWLEDRLVEKLAAKKNVTFEDEINTYKMLNIDLRVVMINFNAEKAVVDAENIIFSNFKTADLDSLSKWVVQSDLFVMAGLNGPFESLCSILGFKKLMVMIHKEPENITDLFTKWADALCLNHLDIVDKGVGGILIADDLAYSQGTYLDLKDMRTILFPIYKKVVTLFKERNIPVFFHCDGNINNIISDLVDIGFSGLHSIEPEAGMDIVEIGKRYGKKICLMGNLSTPLLMEDDVSKVQNEILRLTRAFGKGGGFILGSSAGVLGDSILLKNLYAIKGS